MTVTRPDPSIGVMFSCIDAFGGALTVQVTIKPKIGPPGPADPNAIGLVISDRDGASAISLDPVDQLALARALRVLSRPTASGDAAPATEVQAMAAFAEELENFGYRGCFLSDEAIRMTLAANTTVDGMRAYVESAFQVSQKREGEGS